MTIPTYQASGSVSSHASAGITVAWPTHQAGDLGLLIVNRFVYISATTPTLTSANGFSRFASASVGGCITTAFWCIATSSSMASPVTDANLDSLGDGGIIHTFRGVDQLLPIIAGRFTTGVSSTSLATAAGSSTNWTAKMIPDSLYAAIMTTTTDSRTIIVSGGTNLSSITERYDGSLVYGSHALVDAVPGSDYANGHLTGSVSGSSVVLMTPFMIQPPFSVNGTYSRSRVVNQ